MPDEEILHSLPRQHLREILYLSRKHAAGELGVLPGNTWGLHYPDNAKRNETIDGLLKGSVKPTDDLSALEPDSLVFNAQELSQTEGFDTVNSRILHQLAVTQNYDFHRFADFLSRLKGTGVDAATAQKMYEQVMSGRIESCMAESFVGTAQTKFEEAIRAEGLRTVDGMENASRLERILGALKADWLCEDRKQIRTDQRDKALEFLDETERALYEQMRPAYREFTQKGSAVSYEQLASQVSSNLPVMEIEPESRMSPSTKELTKELEKFMDQVGPVGSEKDPGISLEDKDEYHTPPPQPGGEAKEKTADQPLFEITPSGKSKGPLMGNYCSGRKSYYDLPAKTWSKKKSLNPYNQSVSGDLRQTISRTMPQGLESIPIPNNYAIDMSSLKYKGAQPQIYRDQNGCFYIKTNGSCTYSVDFLEEKLPFISQPIPEDTQSLYRGALSPTTESLITSLSGAPLDKANQAREYLLSRHFYPGGGDHKVAQALQYKLRQMPAEQYIQSLDSSEYLECYSANTLFIAMMRKAGIPARMVIGHRVQSANGGKAVIDSSTGHAWAEVWNGISWIRFDATPRPKPQDKKKQEEKSQDNTPTDNAKDGGIEAPPPPPSESQDGNGSGSGTSLPSDVGDKEEKEAKSNLDKSQSDMDKMEKRKQELKEKIEQAQKSKDLNELKNETDKEDLLEDMNRELQEAIEHAKEKLKNDLEKKLDEMAKDGFLDEKEKEKFKQQLEQFEDTEKIEAQIAEERALYEEYQSIRNEVMPLVNRWYKYFVDQLPKEEEPEVEDDLMGRSGALSRKAFKRPSALMTGRIKNPRFFRPDVKPLFLASIMVDVSGSMGGDKLLMARKLLVFNNELFSKISEEYGYIKYANYIFSDNVGVIKSHDQDYNSATRYDYGRGEVLTVKARLMRMIQASGGTNMLDAVKRAAADLNTQARMFPDYASAFYLIGDGGDTCGNAGNIKQFLQMENTENGFGRHMKAATLLGDEEDRKILAEMFGDENTNVAADFDELITKSMLKFNRDIQRYLMNRTITSNG